MSLTVQNVVDIAKKEVGYYEKESKYLLDVKDANKGNKNYTKYNRDLMQKIGNPYYNPAEWCDMFADWCICEACDWDINRAKKALNGFSAYCPTSAQLYRNANRWSNKPKIGSQFFVGSKGHEEHTGLVIEVISNSIFKTVEGNYNNMVSIVTRYVSQCAGFGMPDYDDYNYNDVYDVNISTYSIKYEDCGTNVKSLQRILKEYFETEEIKIDGECGLITVKYIKLLQDTLGLTPDGICGNKTWNEIINNLK